MRFSFARAVRLAGVRATLFHAAAARKVVTRSLLTAVVIGSSTSAIIIAHADSAIQKPPPASVAASRDSLIHQVDNEFASAMHPADHIRIAKLLENALNAGLPRDAEILWRLARQRSKVAPSIENKEERLKVLQDGMSLAEEALRNDPTSFAASKWCGIVLSDIGACIDTKTKIGNSYKVRDYFQKAVELNPKDGTSRYLLGAWCWAITEISWVERKAASVLFATLPTATYEEALAHYLAAEQAEPGFWIRNWLMIGKAFAKTNHPTESRQWLEKAAQAQPKNSDDVEAIAEAKKLLSK